jgi:hypothetical protein
MLWMLAQMPVYHPVRSKADESVADALGIGKPNLPGAEKSHSIIPGMSSTYLPREILQTRKYRVCLMYDRSYMRPEPNIKCIPQHRAGIVGTKNIIAG